MQTILITGSTRGIGKGLAREFLRLGHRVIVTGRSAGAVKAATDELGQPDRVLGVVCDVRQLASSQAAWDAGVARFGRIDVWINNAAVATDRVLLADLPADQIQVTVDTNLLGTLYGCRVAINGMRSQPGGGKVYTFEGFGSDGLSRPGLSVYGATKRALRYLTASLAKECAGTNVIVGSLSPSSPPTCSSTARRARTRPTGSGRSARSTSSATPWRRSPRSSPGKPWPTASRAAASTG
jgi:NAD(P)-dependent dehydrogenase (short-subunit alcohol dehydrogenase family)